MADASHPVRHVAPLAELVSSYSARQRPPDVAPRVRHKRGQPANQVVPVQLLPCEAHDHCINIWSEVKASSIRRNKDAARHNNCPHHRLPCIHSWPFTVFITFVVDVGGLHGHGAKNARAEVPGGASVFTPDVNIMHGEGKIFPPGA